MKKTLHLLLALSLMFAAQLTAQNPIWTFPENYLTPPNGNATKKWTLS